MGRPSYMARTEPAVSGRDMEAANMNVMMAGYFQGVDWRHYILIKGCSLFHFGRSLMLLMSVASPSSP